MTQTLRRRDPDAPQVGFAALDQLSGHPRLAELYGLELPDQVLRKPYYENALRIIPGIDPRAFRGASR